MKKPTKAVWLSWLLPAAMAIIPFTVLWILCSIYLSKSMWLPFLIAITGTALSMLLIYIWNADLRRHAAAFTLFFLAALLAEGLTLWLDDGNLLYSLGILFAAWLYAVIRAGGGKKRLILVLFQPMTYAPLFLLCFLFELGTNTF